MGSTHGVQVRKASEVHLVTLPLHRLFDVAAVAAAVAVPESSKNVR
jgi:hypothetical protein